MGTDINDEGQVAAPVAGAYGVVNAVSLYRERGRETFAEALAERPGRPDERLYTCRSDYKLKQLRRRQLHACRSSGGGS
jgi:hypothetical protein